MTFGDVADVTFNEIAPDESRVFRLMASDDGAIVAEIAHLRPAGRLRMLLSDADAVVSHRLIACTTEFDDGTFLETNNARREHSPLSISGVTTNDLPRSTGVDGVLQAHRESMRRLGEASTIRPRPARTLDQAIALFAREEDHIAAFRKKVGYILPEEIDRAFGQRWHPWAVRQLKIAIARLELEL